MSSNNFSTLGLSEKLLATIAEMGFSEMTPIQAASIPILLSGRDLIGQSQTGSGKTAAFAIPILQKIQDVSAQPRALILCPTRELCDQVLREFRKFAKSFPGLRCLALVGGQPYPPQINALASGVHIIVGTPGRTLEHIRHRNLDVSLIQTLVLDEADRMLDEGFSEEITEILSELPQQKQTVFFSATFPDSMEGLTKAFQKNAEHIVIQSSEKESLMIDQYVYEAESGHKIDTLIKILQRHPSMSTLVFCRTKVTVDEIGKLLSKLGVSSGVLHGDLEQSQRDRVTSLFRNGSLRVLVATDVAARGLDIELLELVVNVDLPVSAEVYIHRIGRTGRAGRRGTAVSIATAYEVVKVIEIEKATGVAMQRQSLGFKNQHGLGLEFQQTLMKTIQISGGREEKLRPGDILGALTAQPQAVPAADIGKIEIHQRYSLVAIHPSIAESSANKLRNSKIKGKKFKIFIV